ncbi:VOC family protein [Glycomyces luteolus]|uniref:VOC family protein n=1 Tax=Glycomyces luteolus TaxID=2670330 RepID=A0A9X3T5T6_9ACTN|nr:VOC family protein [Glycomyces luteolus]MDA1362320.1 VOC family protein [Glycomyces luteolus]
MVADIGKITFDCQDAYALSLFWTKVTGYTEDPDDPNLPDHEENFIGPDGGHPGLLFVNVPDGAKRIKNRVHLDLVPDTTRDEEVERLLGIGATLVGDHRKDDGTGWVTLADPEGNEFCVERSKAERGED